MPSSSSTGANPVRWDGKDYARHSRIQREFAQQHLAALKLEGNETILDIGCGDGKLTAELAQKAPQGKVLGIDSSLDMIQTARETHQGCHPNLSFALIDAMALPFREEFDLVFSASALHWVKDHIRLLAGIKRALKPQGRIYLLFGGRGSVTEVVRVMDALTKQPAWNDYFQGFEFQWAFYGPEEYRPWMEKLGLAVESLELIDRDVTHPGREAFEGWLRTTWMHYTHRVEPERRQAFLQEAVNLYLQQNPIDGQGLIHVKMVSLLVKGSNTSKAT